MYSVYLCAYNVITRLFFQSLRRRPYKSTARTWLWEGAGLGALILLPFGPVGFAAGAVLGVLLGLCFGLLVDLQKLRRKHSEAERQQVGFMKFTSLIISHNVYVDENSAFNALGSFLFCIIPRPT